jgi:hypothetical protein
MYKMQKKEQQPASTTFYARYSENTGSKTAYAKYGALTTRPLHCTPHTIFRQEFFKTPCKVIVDYVPQWEYNASPEGRVWNSMSKPI